MDELHHRGQQGIGFALVAAGAGGEDYQRRAQALAATEDNMLAEHHLGGEVVGDHLVHPQHIAIGQAFEVFQGKGIARCYGCFVHSAEYRKETGRDLAFERFFYCSDW
jgi:hypothetical protein